MDIAIFRMTRGDGEFSLSHESESEWIEWSGGWVEVFLFVDVNKSVGIFLPIN
jgi:hypothetical protein